MSPFFIRALLDKGGVIIAEAPVSGGEAGILITWDGARVFRAWRVALEGDAWSQIAHRSVAVKMAEARQFAERYAAELAAREGG